MGAVVFSVREFYNQGIEYIGIKSGLLLGRMVMRKILKEEFEDDFLIKDNLNGFIRLRSEELEEMLAHIRRRIGNLPSTSQSIKYYKILSDYVNKTGDFMAAATAPSIVFNYLQTNPTMSLNEMAKLIERKESYPLNVALAIAYIGIERHDLSCIMPETKKWNTAQKLSDLFNCEIKTANENEFLEQKFIDYLAVNGHEIEKIHWRNFERFCAQFFKSEGYTVELGKGTNDGGIDIRVFKEGEYKNTSPFILIQCKRYDSENKVKIETVKSFYTDVQYENAESGLIATSSYISDGGKKVNEVRGYNLSFAEADKIKMWARNMWQYSKPS